MRPTRRHSGRLGSPARLPCWNLPPRPELDPASPVDSVVLLRPIPPVVRSVYGWRA
jgi:hypothetical protein